MLEHFMAVTAFLAPLGYTTYRWTADEVIPQYLVLAAPGWGPAEQDLSRSLDEIDVELRVTAVAGTSDGVSIMLDRIRALAPRVAARVPMTGRVVTLGFLRSEFIDVDRDTVIVNTDRHPAFGVDTYRLISEPLL